MPTVAFATHQEMPELTDDDRLVANLLRDHGVNVSPVVWDEPDIDWSRFDGVVIRSTWDYHLKPDRYADWLRRFLMDGRLWNPPEAVLGNMNKQYLLALAAQGIDVVPTVFLHAGHAATLTELLESCHWDEVVIKPAVSASGWGTWRTSRAAATVDHALFAQQIRERYLLIQPYISEIAVTGEWSLVFFAGRYSHAVIKRPANGDFRVQRHFGGVAIAAEPAANLIAQAESALATIKHPLLYARVDGVERQGRFMLMELEINEPFLFLSYSEKAGQRFADAITNCLRVTNNSIPGDAGA